MKTTSMETVSTGVLEEYLRSTWNLFTKKMRSYGYKDPHYKPKTVWWPSQVYNGNPYTDKTASWWIEALDGLYSVLYTNYHCYLGP